MAGSSVFCWLVSLPGEAASDHEAADGFLDSIKKIIGEKGYQPEQVYNVD